MMTSYPPYYDSDGEEELGLLIYKSSLMARKKVAEVIHETELQVPAAATVAVAAKKKTSNKRQRLSSNQPSCTDEWKAPPPNGRRANRPTDTTKIIGSQPHDLHNTRSKDIKPRFKAGKKVYAAWWPGENKSGSPSWYPATIKSYRKVKSVPGPAVDLNHWYGPLRLYDLEYDDGDELDSVDDKYIFTKEDYLLLMRHNDVEGHEWIGLQNVIDPESSDGWASTVGWYNIVVDGRVQSFSFLSDALRAYDASVVEAIRCRGKKITRKRLRKLNLPEEQVSKGDDDQERSTENSSIHYGNRIDSECPSTKIVQWISSNISKKRQRKNVTNGLRVKVRFDNNTWYGGSITKVKNEGRRVEILFDDGTIEVAKFPDKDIIIDATNNERYSARAAAFAPDVNLKSPLKVRNNGSIGKVNPVKDDTKQFKKLVKAKTERTVTVDSLTKPLADGTLTLHTAQESTRIPRKRQRKE